MKRVTESVDAPFLVNIDGGGRLGELTAPEIERLGFRIAIYPGLERYAAGFAMREALGALKRDGSTRAVQRPHAHHAAVQRSARALRYRGVGEEVLEVSR